LRTIDRALAALLGLTVSSGLTVLLSLSPLHPQNRSEQKSYISVALVPAAGHPKPLVQETPLAVQDRGARPIAREATINIDGVLTTPLGTAEVGLTAAALALPASSALVLDRSTLSSINRDSKSNFRQLVDASAAYAGDQKMSASQTLAASVDAAAKPDCLDRNGGGSLFSIPIIVYLLVKDKCK
jgi:hypothetical protein